MNQFNNPRWNPNQNSNPNQNQYGYNNPNGYRNRGGYYSPNYQNQFGGYYNDQRRQIKQRQIKEIDELLICGLALGGALLLYLLLESMCGMILSLVGLYDLYESSSLFQSCFSIVLELIGVALPFGLMALITKNKYSQPLVPTKKLKALDLWSWVAAGMVCTFIANYAASAVSSFFEHHGYNASNQESPAVDSIFACVIEVISIAVIPPICEEFAMRCCSIGLLKKYGKGFAVCSISLVFGLMHCNLVQFVFAFLVGLALGHVTVKTDSIIPAILIHGFNNGRSVLNDIVTYAAGENAANTVSIVVFVLWIILGIAGIAYLAVKKKLFDPYKKANPADLSPLTKFACLLPGLALPFIAFIVIIITSITKTTA